MRRRETWGRDRRCAASALSRGLEDLALAEAHRRITLGPAVYVPPWQRMLVFVLVAGLAVSLLVAGVVLRQGGGDGLAVATTVPAAAPLTLDELAAVARSQPHVTLDDHRSIHLITDRVPSEAQRAEGLAGWREEQWIAADGSGLSRTLPLTGAAPTGDDDYERHGPGELAVANLLPAQIAGLPADPAALLATVRTSNDDPVRPEHLVALLGVPTVAPDVRGGLVEALERFGATAVEAPSPGDGSTRLSTHVGDEVVEITFDRLTARPTALHVRTVELSLTEPAKTSYRLAEIGLA